MNSTYTAYIRNGFCGIHSKGEGFGSQYLALKWATDELKRVKRRVHFSSAIGLEIVILANHENGAVSRV